MQNQSKKKNFCSQKSKVKLVVFDTNNIAKTPWYSFVKHDRTLGYEQIMAKMEESILRNIFKEKFNCAIFYNNQTGQEIKKINATEFRKSKVKLLVYDYKNERFYHYPDALLNQKNEQYICGALQAKYLENQYKNNFNTAIFYDQNDQQILSVKGMN